MYEYVQSKYTWEQAEKLIQELAWRDYWQQVWRAKGDGIHTDLKNPQCPVNNHRVPKAVVQACTGIRSLDNAIHELYRTGYMHNHLRMYVASLCCNVSQSHWLQPALWLYTHLLDGDLASNQLSWQWVAGAFSSKKYYANQDNINKYTGSEQKGTFLDIPYEAFDSLSIPEVMADTVEFDVSVSLPDVARPDLRCDTPTLIYNYYNLDAEWHQGEELQRVLLLEPSVFARYPISQQCIDFMLALSKNIPGIVWFVGEFAELAGQVDANKIIYKEHPLNDSYRGKQEDREWLSQVSGYYPSFFAFWKKCKKELRYE